MFELRQVPMHFHMQLREMASVNHPYSYSERNSLVQIDLVTNRFYLSNLFCYFFLHLVVVVFLFLFFFLILNFNIFEKFALKRQNEFSCRKKKSNQRTTHSNRVKETLTNQKLRTIIFRIHFFFLSVSSQSESIPITLQ